MSKPQPSMIQDDVALIEDVRRYLDDHQADYRDLLNDVREQLTDQLQPDDAFGLRAIYDRTEVQGKNNLFKDSNKIAEKLRRWRIRKPSAKLFDIPDIVGIRVVCLFHCHQKKIVQHLRNFAASKESGWSIPTDGDRAHLENGYFAHHFWVRTRSRGRAICEIQIQTALHEAWSRKTHKITYKPKGHITESLSALLDEFGAALEFVEKQSEGLREMIESHWEFEREYRKVSRREIARSFWLDFAHVKQTNPSWWADLKEPYSRIERLVKDMLNRIDDVDQVDINLEGAVSELEKLLESTEKGLRDAAAQLFVTLAFFAPRQVLDTQTLHVLRDWVEDLTGVDRAKGLLLLGFTYSGFGDLSRGIHYTKEALSQLGKAPSAYIAQGKINLATMLLDQMFQARAALVGAAGDVTKAVLIEALSEVQRDFKKKRRTMNGSGREAMLAKCMNVTQELRRAIDKPDLASKVRTKLLVALGETSRDDELAREAIALPALIDTIGLYHITTGVNEGAIRAGLSLCASCTEIPFTKDYANAWLPIRERRAWRRIFSLTTSG